MAIQTGDSMLIRENMMQQGSSSPEHSVCFPSSLALAVIVSLSKTAFL